MSSIIERDITGQEPLLVRTCCRNPANPHSASVQHMPLKYCASVISFGTCTLQVLLTKICQGRNQHEHYSLIALFCRKFPGAHACRIASIFRRFVSRIAPRLCRVAKSFCCRYTFNSLLIILFLSPVQSKIKKAPPVH
jgi:hypothetical protein